MVYTVAKGTFITGGIVNAHAVLGTGYNLNQSFNI